MKDNKPTDKDVSLLNIFTTIHKNSDEIVNIITKNITSGLNLNNPVIVKTLLQTLIDNQTYIIKGIDILQNKKEQLK